jgi:hypothetical protein
MRIVVFPDPDGSHTVYPSSRGGLLFEGVNAEATYLYRLLTYALLKEAIDILGYVILLL